MIIVIKSNRVIAKQLQSKLVKVCNNTFVFNGSTAWLPIGGTHARKNDIIDILNTYKKQRFEICCFTEKQLALTVNKIGFTGLSEYNKKLINLPLKHTFFWYEKDRFGRQSCTPLSTAQFNNIVYINRYSDKIAEQMYIDFLNDFLTIECFASYYNITRYQALSVLSQGKQFHMSKF